MEDKQLWNCEISEIIAGYEEEKEQYRCVMCGKTFTKGNIYTSEQQWLDAYGALKKHIASEHKSSLDYLLTRDVDLIGISEVQQQILQLMAAGKDDKEIAKTLGIALSTVRNHRFKLREKAKQAKLYLALMQSLEEKMNSKINMTDHGAIEEIHATATMVDNRFVITEQEREKTIKTYMEPDGSLKQFPAREKKKIILLGEIMKKFRRGVVYTEHEVNEVLSKLFSDYPTLRRALIEYGFMERSNDCKVYQVKE